jgi:nitrite reductase/ring-hydroxylating ferredoxin subunit
LYSQLKSSTLVIFMTRYEFLKSMGFTGAALMAALTSCVQESDTYYPAPKIGGDGVLVEPPTSTPVVTPTVPATSITDISKITNPLAKVDISTASTSKLKTVGGYVIVSNIVIAQVSAGAFAAVTNLCTHEPKRQVIYSGGEFYCTAHGARFSLTGVPLNQVSRTNIIAYKVATDGKTVVVY